MDNDQFQRNLQLMGQGLQLQAAADANRIAQETAAATSQLLRAQEQQKALEQQRLAVEQQRLQEEQRRTELAAQEQQRRIQLAENEANAKKAQAEKVKSIRVQMAAMEEEIGDFQGYLSKIGGNPPSVGGVPVATYTFLLLQRKLEKRVAQKSDLHELGDIRFMGQLEKSVRELRQAFPDFCGDSPVKGALQYLEDLADWPMRSVRLDGKDTKPSRLLQDVRKASEGFLETFEKAGTQITSSAVIARLFSEIATQEQLLKDAETAFANEWSGVEPQVKNLESIGVGLIEAIGLVGISVPHLVELTDPIDRLRQSLSVCRRGLEEASKNWDKDNAAVQRARQHIAEGRLQEAQQTLESLEGRTWADIDSRLAQSEFENAQNRELKRLIVEADKLAESAPLEAVRQLESRAPEYAKLEPVFSVLLVKRKELLTALEAQLLAEITQIEAKDRKEAVRLCDDLMKRSEGLPELQVGLFQKTETIKASIKLDAIKHRKKFIVGIQGVCVIFGLVAVAASLPELKILENFVSADVAPMLEVYVAPVLAVICFTAWIYLVLRISAFTKIESAVLPTMKQAVQRFQFEAANNAKQAFAFSKSERVQSSRREWKASVGVEGFSKQLLALGAVKPGDLFINSLGHRFRWCPSGEFMMGSLVEEQIAAKVQLQILGDLAEGDINVEDEKLHHVIISRGYWLGEHPVTQSQWKAIMGRSQHKQISTKKSELYRNWLKKEAFPKENSQAPAYCVNWEEAAEYCLKLTEREVKAGRIPEGWHYRLPTEAQWEYGCRAGTSAATYAGGVEYITPNSSPTIDRVAWYWGNASSDFRDGGGFLMEKFEAAKLQSKSGPAGPHEVGKKEANPWGVSDTLGNVWEWCSDWYAAYDDSIVLDPIGPSSGKNRVLRGGAWFWFGAASCRAACRNKEEPGSNDGDVFLNGLRVALVPPRLEMVRQHLLQVLKQRTEDHNDNA